MKPLLILVLVAGCIVWMLWSVSGQKHSIPNEVLADAPKPTSSPNKTSVAKPARHPDSDSDVFNEDGSLKRLPAGTKIYNFWGYVRQHLEGGNLLIECGSADADLGQELRVFQNRALLTRGEGSDLIDGAQVRFAAIPSGVYQYVDVTGASRTIRQLLYIPPEALPENKKTESLPPSATGVFAIYPPGVDTPEKRREFLQAQIEAKKNGTAPVQRTTNRTRGY